jgi:hypothetical protein
MSNLRIKSIFAGRETVQSKDGTFSKAIILKQTKQDLNFVKIYLPSKGFRMYPRSMTISTRDLFDYLCVVMDRMNIAIAPALEVEERVGLSSASFSRAKHQLMEHDYIRQRASGIYMINPDIACKTDGNGKSDLYGTYEVLPSITTKDNAIE